MGVASFSSLGLDTYSGPFCHSVLVKSRRQREGGRGHPCPSVGECKRTRGCVHLAADPSRDLRVAEGAPSPPSAPSSSLLAYKVTGAGLDLVPHGVLSVSCSPHPGNLASCASAPARRTLGFQGSSPRDQLVAPGGAGGAESSPSEDPQGGLSPPVRRGFRVFLPKTAGARPHSHRTMAWNSCLDHAWAPLSASSVPDDLSRSLTPAAWPGGSLWGHYASMGTRHPGSACTRCDSRSPGREDIREPTV